MRVVASSLLATKKVEWLTAFRVAWRRGVLYLGVAPGRVLPVPLNLTEDRLCGHAYYLDMRGKVAGFVGVFRSACPHNKERL